MENTKSSFPIFEAGKLRTECFASEQDRLEAFAEALLFTQDLTETIKGINGQDGSTGDPGRAGNDGANGANGVSPTATTTLIAITSGSTYVEVPSSTVSQDTFNIHCKRNVLVGGLPAFVEGDGIVGVGAQVVDTVGDKTRIYFVFFGCATVPNDDWELVWTKWA